MPTSALLLGKAQLLTHLLNFIADGERLDFVITMSAKTLPLFGDASTDGVLELTELANEVRVTSLSVTKAGRKRKRAAAGGGGDGSVVFDFTGGSLPAGMYQYTGSNAQPTLTWDSTGARFTGDAGSGQYPLRIPQAFTGDYLFQLSTRIDRDSSTSAQWCSDASIGLFNTTYTSTSGYLGNGEHKQAESPHKIM